MSQTWPETHTYRLQELRRRRTGQAKVATPGRGAIQLLKTGDKEKSWKGPGRNGVSPCRGHTEGSSLQRARRCPPRPRGQGRQSPAPTRNTAGQRGNQHTQAATPLRATGMRAAPSRAGTWKARASGGSLERRTGRPSACLGAMGSARC